MSLPDDDGELIWTFSESEGAAGGVTHVGRTGVTNVLGQKCHPCTLLLTMT